MISLPWGLSCVEVFRDCLGYTLCFLCLAKVGRVIGSNELTILNLKSVLLWTVDVPW